MQNKLISSVDRRRFLGLGTLVGVLGVLGVAGCDSSETVGKPTAEPVEKGNRKRLEMLQDKAAETKDKKK